MNTKEIGSLAEEAALSKLLEEGYTLYKRNYFVPNCGELDLVVTKDGELFVAEVKARQIRNDNVWGSPVSAITRSKYLKLLKTTRIMMARDGLYDMNIYFLAISVGINEGGFIQNVEIIPF